MSALLTIPELQGFSVEELQALEILSDHFGSSIEEAATLVAANEGYDKDSVVEWGEHNFFIPETQYYIKFYQHQKVILNCMFHDPRFSRAQTLIYSAPKKSGKTAIAALVGRWATETWGRYGEVYCIANDEEQALGRLYQAIKSSIEMDPSVVRKGSVTYIPEKWRIVKRRATHLPSGSYIEALSGDYKGQAGSNPMLTLWTELWGYTSEDSMRLWSEMTPSPVRKRSKRFVETYAGYEGESELLWGLWESAVKYGRQLTHADVSDWPFEGPIPLYYNESAHIFAYIDTGVEGRRMPWQTPDYYEAEAADLTPEQFDRLHLNHWVTPLTEFIPFEWWDRIREPLTLPKLPEGWPIVMSADAAVSSDCCAVSSAARDPRDTSKVIVPFYHIWYPPQGGKFDYGADGGLEQTIRYRIQNYNIVQLAYDEYQLHDLMTRMMREAIVWTRQFSQANPRGYADKQLYDLIRDQRIHHNVGSDADEHIRNSDRKQSLTEDTKMRIVKRREKGKIDFTVATSMAAEECLRLNLA